MDPGDLWIPATILGRHATRGFAKDLQQADQSQIEHPIGIEVASNPPAYHVHRLARMITHLAEDHLALTPGHTGPRPPPELDLENKR